MFPDQSRVYEPARHPFLCHPRLHAWSCAFGAMFSAITLLSMVASADWNPWLVLTDPLAWMMLFLAAAAGVSTGYALSCRVGAGRNAI
ncbi:MAG TPA: hypothetical protein VFG49_01530 [Dyella sp.]|uniref:hypothetical protein n=1 Tax=Dyella sp. TaxID=1869338 RepID=UPI002D78DE64|nr:hypothetical protein [Dyella sp.]HET6552193.1 hypothetical protein [Dyella sp.]